VRIVRGGEEGRKTLLRRQPLGEEKLPDEIWQATRAAVGDVATPEEAARKIVRDVRQEGDAAVLRYCEAFDGAAYSTLQLDDAERKTAYEEVDSDLVHALRFAAERIGAYHEQQRDHVLRTFESDGVGMVATAVGRAGINAPGTAVVYPSTVLMTVIPAKAAGVDEVLLASPADKEGRVSPLKLVAADIAGADGVFRMSGAQAVAAFAYGTESVPRVDIVGGPGNLFVTLAKRLVFGDVGIDALYGPSETIVIADSHADPVLCAADLLGQAEHDELATPILITTSADLAENVSEEVERQVKLLEREKVARSAFAARGGAVVVDSIDEAIALANEFAPEHLCLSVQDAEQWAGKVLNAGGVFIGERSPETLGDYTAGPSHAMPTMGSARFASPLGVHNFLKVSSRVGVDDDVLREIGPAAAKIARAEGFTAHARTIELRLGQPD